MKAYRVFWLFFCGVLGAARRSHGLHLVTHERHHAARPRGTHGCSRGHGRFGGPRRSQPTSAGSTTDRGPQHSPHRGRHGLLHRPGHLGRRADSGATAGHPRRRHPRTRFATAFAGSSNTATWPARHLGLSDRIVPTARQRPATAPILGTEPDQAPKPHIAPDALSDEALCVAWRASFSALQRAGSPTQRLRIVDERRAYLDEIERRTAHGMAAWLASGPRAAGDPSRFVLGDGAAGRAPIDWDDLLHDTDK